MVTVKTPDSDFDKWLQKLQARAELSIIEQMKSVGELAVSTAKKSGKYTDRTGNLRSSIGYCVVNNGRIVYKGKFTSVNAPEGNGSFGTKSGEEYLKSVAVGYSGLWLLLVAGMPYAAHVEAIGLDVISSGQLIVDKLPKALDKLGFKILHI